MKKVLLLILSIFIFGTLSPNALALSNVNGSDPTGKSQRSIIEKTPWLDPTACADGGVSGVSGVSFASGSCSCQSLSGGGGAGNLTGNDNRDKVWNYLISKGLTPFQAAGMMGNMQAEAGFEPRLVEYAFSRPPHLSDTVPDNQKTNGQPGYGIVQFTSPGYKQALRDRSAQKAVIAGDLGLQLDYLWELLISNSWGTNLRATTTINDASDVFLKQFEIPKNIAGQIGIRRGFAEVILSDYSGSVVTSSTSNSGANQGCESSISQGSSANVVLVAQQELASQGDTTGGDKYELGDKSIPWCAAFVSYVLKKAGVPFTGGVGENGYYIPSVASVRSYFEASPSTYHPARSGYVPQPGDIVIYKEGLEPYPSHVNIVISVDGSKMTTIGGNEGNKVSQNVISNYNDSYITGFGTPKGVK